MTSPVSAYSNSTNSLINSGSGGRVSGGPAPVANADSEVIAQVVSTPMQSSNINEVVAPVRESIEKLPLICKNLYSPWGVILIFQ